MDSILLFNIVQSVVTVLAAVLGAGGFWAYLQKRVDKKDAKTQMLAGLGHDRIMELGKSYIERGSIAAEEYENLFTYLYQPYEELGFNGSAKRIMDEVKRLPIRS